jgi:hypothetical protein
LKGTKSGAPIGRHLLHRMSWRRFARRSPREQGSLKPQSCTASVLAPCSALKRLWLDCLDILDRNPARIDQREQRPNRRGGTMMRRATGFVVSPACVVVSRSVLPPQANFRQHR